MIRLNKKLLFAIEAVLDIAYNGGAAPVRSAEITARQGIPRRYLEPVLQELVRHKVLIGIRGPSGGYRLARERRRVSVGDIVRTVRELETVADPIEAPSRQRARPSGVAAALARAAGRDDAPPRRADARRFVHAGAPRRGRRPGRRGRRFRHLASRRESTPPIVVRCISRRCGRS